MDQITLSSPCHFGLESVLSYEIKKIGGTDLKVTDGKIVYKGDIAMIAKANIHLRTAERVHVVLGEFSATTFSELFDGVNAIAFEKFIGKHDAFPVKGWSLNSQLHSIPDCQSIIKKAIVKRLEKIYNISWFEETDTCYQVQFSIHKDMVTILLDTSGVGLHKRGYRQTSNEAPIKETLAAGIIDLARIRSNSVVYDPMCGSGTILIESAMHALKIAPGLRRRFACEYWDLFKNNIFKDERAQAVELVETDATYRGYGADIDSFSTDLTLENAKKAGVVSKIQVYQQDIADTLLKGEKPVVITNPPYGERMMELKEAEELYKRMGEAFSNKEASYYIISPHEEFEYFFGKKCNKKRKLYNGMLKCNLYMYFK